MRRAVLIGLLSAGLTVATFGQGGFNNNSNDGFQRNEFSAQISGVFTATKTTTLNQHLATDSAGLLVGYRFHFNRWEALEVEYGYTRNGQRYSTPGTAPGTPAANYAIESNMQQFLVNEVFTTPRIAGFFQPFILGGGGVVLFQPRGASAIAVSNQHEGAFNLGAGVDFHIFHIGARAEFQALFLKSPDFGNPLLSTDKWTHVAQPSAGLIFTF